MCNAMLDENEMDRLPFGRTDFSSIRRDENIYVDKTEMVRRLARIKGAPVFLSRPRRFGKSLLTSTFESLFSSGLADFEGLDIDTGKNKWADTTYKVVRFDLSVVANSAPADLRIYLNNKMIREIYGNNHYLMTSGNNETCQPGVILDNIRGDKDIADKSIVFLIDEYDSPVTHHLNRGQVLNDISDILDSFFAGIKSAERIFRFVFVTGITRIAHISLFSIFNNIYDISADDDYATLLGITEDELHKYFDPYVRNAAAVLDMSVSDVYAKMKSVYNGFQFSIGNEETVYNPWSVISFLKNPKNGFRNYWYSTSGGTPTALVRYLENADSLEIFNKLSDSVKEEENRDNIVTFDEITAKSESFQIPMKMLLLQTGYFTLRTVSFPYGKIAVPNEEVAESLIRLSLDVHNLKSDPFTDIELLNLEKLTDSKDIPAVFRLFNAILCENVSSNSPAFNNENSIRDIIYARIPEKGILKSKEMNNCHGYSDLEIKTKATKLVIEFKRMRDGVSQKAAMKEALHQLTTHEYGATPAQIEIIRVGMVISPKERCIKAYEILEEKPDKSEQARDSSV